MKRKINPELQKEREIVARYQEKIAEMVKMIPVVCVQRYIYIIIRDILREGGIDVDGDMETIEKVG